MALSRTQVDKLGERLKAGPISEDDLRLLDEYKTQFAPAYSEVQTTLEALGLDPRGRETKSLQSIVDKLRRESIRLTQIQDIAGCRLWVFDLNEQDAVARRIGEALPGSRWLDRRAAPSHGYRALHLVAQRGGLLVEIQIRTEFQHRWARTCEILADRLGTGLKYGKGPPEMLAHLSTWSDAVRHWEEWVATREQRGSSTLEAGTEAERAHQFALEGQAESLALRGRLQRIRDTDRGEP